MIGSRKLWVPVALGGLVVAIVGLAAWGAVAYTARPDFCAGCHLMQTRYVSWKRSPHVNHATCIQCHAEPGFVGEIKAHLNGTRYLWVMLTGAKSGPILRAEVSTATCAQCHPPAALDGVRTAAVQHGAHLARGVECAVCHAGLVHGSLHARQARPATATCDACHAVERPLPGRPRPPGSRAVVESD